MTIVKSRRTVLSASGALLAGGLVSACSGGDKDVGAVEDLMREHGILRRAILLFREAAARLRQPSSNVDPAALAETARLFRSFGKDYHERKLEEAYIFPAVKQQGGRPAAMVDVLIAQHNRGREIIDYVLSVTAKGSLAPDGGRLADALDHFERMYENHAAREDTILFQAWRNGMSAGELDEMGDKFEDIEKQQFGGDGFDQAARQMDRIEQAMGLSDLAQFTAPPA